MFLILLFIDGSYRKNIIFLELILAHLCILIIKGKDILVLVEGPTQGLDDTTLTAEAKYPNNFTQSGKRFVLSLHYNGNNSSLFVDATNVCQYKAKISEIKNYTLCLGNISKDVTINNMTKTGLKGVVKLFSVDFNPVDTKDILDIHRYLMKRT